MGLDELGARLASITPDVAREEEVWRASLWRPEELPGLLRAAEAEGCAVTVGEGPLARGLRVDLARLRELSVDEPSLTVTAGAGWTLGGLEEALALRGFTLGPPPGDVAGHRVGGAVAGRSIWRLGRVYGYVEDPVLSVDALLWGGGRYRSTAAPRRAAGPDLARLLCGSEGRLGILLGARLRIFRRPAYQVSRGWRFSSLAEAGWAARRILAAGCAPADLFGREVEGGARVVARWDGERAALPAARARAAEAVAGPAEEDPGPWLAARYAPSSGEARPCAEALLPYAALGPLLAALAGRAEAEILQCWSHAALVRVSGVEPEVLFAQARAQGGIPSPCAALYELFDRWGHPADELRHALQRARRILDEDRGAP